MSVICIDSLRWVFWTCICGFKKKNLLLEIISQRPCTPSRINFIIAMEASPRPPLPPAEFVSSASDLPQHPVFATVTTFNQIVRDLSVYMFVSLPPGSGSSRAAIKLHLSF